MTKQRENKSVNSFAVAPSPFNSVKLELGIVMALSALLLVALDSITKDLFLQILLLSFAGLLGMGWIIWRTRRLIKRQSTTASHERVNNTPPARGL